MKCISCTKPPPLFWFPLYCTALALAVSLAVALSLGVSLTLTVCFFQLRRTTSLADAVSDSEALGDGLALPVTLPLLLMAWYSDAAAVCVVDTLLLVDTDPLLDGTREGLELAAAVSVDEVDGRGVVVTVPLVDGDAVGEAAAVDDGMDVAEDVVVWLVDCAAVRDG